MPILKVSDETYKLIKKQLTKKDKVVKPIQDLEDMIGQTLTFWCSRYIYHGEVKAVNDTFITLTDAGIVYETGELDESKAKDLQELPNDCHVLIQSIEAIIPMEW
jgi:hypothetical protein